MSTTTRTTTFTALAIVAGGFLAALLLMGASNTGLSVFADTATTTVTVGNAAPTVSALSLNGGSAITLTENTSVTATGTLTVTDANGCSSITNVTGTAYRAAPTTDGTSCTSDNNNCYIDACSVVGSGNTCTGGADTSADYECTFTIWYIADPTDSGAFASDIWAFAATSTDGTDTGTATNTAETIELNTLLAHDVSATIPYGTVAANTDTGATNQTATITNTGNASLDTEISGEDMCTDFPGCAGDTLAELQQKFGLTDVTYASLTNTLTATTSPATVTTVLAKPTATTSAVTDDTFWGIAIPNGQASGSYTGQNLFTAISG